MANNILIKFDNAVGRIKPLNGVCCAPYSIFGGKDQWFIREYIKEGNIPYCRTHDCCGGYGGSYFVDITNIFRDFDADENDPASYDFHYSDEYIEAVQNAGCETYYRLGETIEWGSKKYRTNKPADFAKWARICEHIIMHYNYGWADGFNFGITYWEIWNEPENPGNVNGPSMWGGTKEEFFELYEVSSKYLKAKFPEIKIGGYGSCGFYPITREGMPDTHKAFVTYFTDFLDMVKKTGSPLDFYSWHIYTHSEKELLTHAKYVREMLDEKGFSETEAHLNEWNIGDEGTGFADKHSMVGGSFLAAVMCMLQNTNYVDKAMYYCFSLNGIYDGFIDQNDRHTSPAWYPFAAFGKLAELGEAVESNSDLDGVYTLAAKNDDKKLILVSNYRSEENKVTIKTDSQGKAEVMIIDATFQGFGSAKTETLDSAADFEIDLPKNTVALIKIS